MEEPSAHSAEEGDLLLVLLRVQVLELLADPHVHDVRVVPHQLPVDPLILLDVLQAAFFREVFLRVIDVGLEEGVLVGLQVQGALDVRDIRLKFGCVEIEAQDAVLESLVCLSYHDTIKLVERENRTEGAHLVSDIHIEGCAFKV